MRPFSKAIKMECRSYSTSLQRVIVDFGADVSFQSAQKKIREHYNIEIPVSSIQAIVKNHAKNTFHFQEKKVSVDGTARQLISETDGVMIPLVETTLSTDGSLDRRRNRQLRWGEARLCFSRGAQQITPMFYATLGDVDRVGDLLYKSALRVNFGEHTKVHAVGDGAKWIENQMRRVFGSQLEYLVDFYHVSEYLWGAAEHSWTGEKAEWVKKQQELLKTGKVEEVLSGIRLKLPVKWEEEQEKKKKASKKGRKENKTEETPVEKCYKYIANRKHCLDYKAAIENELPIGSGEIESAHRFVIQKRLKIPGAWWKPETAEYMLCLRTLRENDDWERYWAYVKAA